MSNRVQEIKDAHQKNNDGARDYYNQHQTLSAKQKYINTMKLLKWNKNVPLAKSLQPYNVCERYSKKEMNHIMKKGAKNGICFTNNNDVDIM